MTASVKINLRLNINTFFYFLFSVFLALIFVQHVVGIYIPNVAFLLLVAVISCIGNQNHIIAMCMCCIPISSALEIYQLIIICVVTYIIKFHNECKASGEVVLITFLLIWELMHCTAEGVNLVPAIVFIFPYILCVLIVYGNLQKVDYGFVCRTLAICTLFMCFVVISKMLNEVGWNISLAISNMTRFGIFTGVDEGDLYFNPNALGYFCLLAVIGLIQNMQYKKDVLMIFLLVIFGIFTLSRTYVVCLAITVMLFLAVKKESTIGKLKMILRTACLAMAVGCIMLLAFPEIISDLQLRFIEDDVSGGRFQLLKTYNQYILSSGKSLMWGTGLVARRIVLQNYFDSISIVVPHNGIQELIVVWGLPGMVVWILFFFCLIKKSRNINPYQSLINYIPLIILLIKIQAGQLVSSYYTILMFPLAFLSLCYNFKKDRVS